MPNQVNRDSDHSDLNRKQAEAEFHDRRARERLECAPDEFLRRWSNKKFYSVTRGGKAAIDSWVKRLAPGATALDYCCGQGLTSIDLAKAGATAYGIDISAEEVATAQQHAAEAGVSDRTHFAVMDAEQLEFPNGFFDMIVCNGVLHHLDVTKAYPELARVLKPGGQVLCIEALGYNPVINLYRRRTPHLRTAWETEHILTLRDLKRAREHFGEVRVTFFYLFVILAVPFRNTRIFKVLLWSLELIDRVVLRIPFVQLMAWQMVFVLSGPRTTDSHRTA